MVRGPNHHWSGPHLPVSAGRLVIACFRCAEDRRVLRDYTLGRHGRAVGSIKLCDPCYADVTPLNPDPLDATEVA